MHASHIKSLAGSFNRIYPLHGFTPGLPVLPKRIVGMAKIITELAKLSRNEVGLNVCRYYIVRSASCSYAVRPPAVCTASTCIASVADLTPAAL